MAASPLPSRGPKRGRKCYVTPAFSGIPNTGGQNLKWVPHPCLLGGPKDGEMRRHPCIPGDPQHRGTQSKVVASPLPSQGAQKRAEMLCHPCILMDPQRQARGAKSEGVPNKGEQNQKWLRHPCLLRGPKEGGNPMSPLHSQGSPTPSAGSKIRSGPRHRGGGKFEVATSPLPFGGPKRGRKCYVTPTFSGSLNRGSKRALIRPMEKSPSERETRSEVANKWPERLVLFFMEVLKPSKFFFLFSET